MGWGMIISVRCFAGKPDTLGLYIDRRTARYPIRQVRRNNFMSSLQISDHATRGLVGRQARASSYPARRCPRD